MGLDGADGRLIMIKHIMWLGAVMAFLSLGGCSDDDTMTDTGVDSSAPDGGDDAGGDGGGDAQVMCPDDMSGYTFASGTFTRVDRMGMPAVSTAVISAGMKNAYNDASPADDATNVMVGEMQLPMFAAEIATNLAGLHAALDDDLEGLGLVPCGTVDPDNIDPFAVLPCALQAVGSTTVLGLVVPDTLKIDPSADAGFPNGRTLTDPVIDVTLAVILLDLTMNEGGAATFATADLDGDDIVGVNPPANDAAFSPDFPYLAAAQE
jgi:hypothetical protein